MNLQERGNFCEAIPKLGMSAFDRRAPHRAQAIRTGEDLGQCWSRQGTISSGKRANLHAGRNVIPGAGLQRIVAQSDGAKI
jgi:hypothetical protein